MKSSTRLSVIAALISLLALVVIGISLISTYIAEERERDLLQWESRLGLIADGKADAVARLLAGYRRDLDELADNASLRFYLWQVTRPPADAQPGAPEPGSLGYLRNLLLAAAERSGYVAPGGARVAASLPQPRTAGLALFDADLQPVVATAGLVDGGVQYADVVRAALAGPATRSATLMLDGQDRPVIVTVALVRAVPGVAAATGADPALGALVGVRSAEDELFPLLARAPSFAEDNEALLLARRGGAVALLSPLRDGSPALRRSLPADRDDLAEVRAMTNPGEFVGARNYRGDDVLQVSRPVRGQDWVLAQQVNATQAMSLADERRGLLWLSLSLLLFGIVTMAVAAWRHGSSVRARHQAEELADRAARLQRQTDLLHTITDNIDVLTLLVTRDERALFVNHALAEAAGRSISETTGQPLAGFLPAAVLGALQDGIRSARSAGVARHRLLAWPRGDEPREYLAGFIPVARIGAETDLTLLVLSDLTDLQRSQKRNAALLRKLVLTLVGAVDRHDPYSANHAQRMTEVVDALAAELGFSEADRATLDLAASLANIGKIMVPVEILTKREPLTAAEQAEVHKHVEYGLELLRGLQFDQPVLELIAQKQERPDGRGYPRGLSAERLTLAGQVLAVANAFVALASPRAYRPGMSPAAAVAELMRGAGTQFDRRVVAALHHVVENRRDWSQWQ